VGKEGVSFSFLAHTAAAGRPASSNFCNVRGGCA
jgi:hypothetical protein